MSETHYWPGEDEIGVYCIQHNCGQSHEAKNADWLGDFWLLADEDGMRTTENLIASGYLGVRREKPEPEQVDYYWPLSGEVGPHLIWRDGMPNYWELGLDGKWHSRDRSVVRSTQEMIERGYLGVKKPRVVPMPILPIEPSENEVIAAQALSELRLCRKPFETERWAYEWGQKLCQMLGAES